MATTIPLTAAKARLSEIVRSVRRNRTDVTITVDGEPAVRIVPAPEEPRDLTPQEVATERALVAAAARIPRPTDRFDAVALVREGRR